MFWVNGSLAHFFWATWANCSFLVSEMSDFLTLLIWFDWNEQFTHIAHFLWATWANCSQSLISSERPERFTHSRSFVLSDLSESLTVAHLIWAKWVNERMSEFPALHWWPGVKVILTSIYFNEYSLMGLRVNDRPLIQRYFTVTLYPIDAYCSPSAQRHC